MENEDGQGVAGAGEGADGKPQDGATKPRRPRSDKGKPRERAFCATMAGEGDNDIVYARGATEREVMEQVAARLMPGAEVEVWCRIGKPRKATLTFK